VFEMAGAAGHAESRTGDLTGKILSHFRVATPLGAGGMGTVYRAEDLLLRRPVALKVLVSADDERRARMLREARTAAAVSHPNIAAVFEVGEADGVVFIAMELIEGASLRELLAAGRLPVPRALAIAHDVARGLAKAHASSVVHRDIKPENVMVDREGEVKLLDFGIAKAMLSAPNEHESLDRQDTETAPVTGEGQIIGTPEYMSPEQIRGEETDARSDVFSFGSMLYEMLTGRRPFAQDSVMETAIAISRDDPPPVDEANTEVSDAVAHVVRRCLAKRPSERYADAAEVAAELRLLAGVPTPSGPRTAPPPAQPARRRSWRRVVAGMVAAAALLAGILWTVYLAARRSAGPTTVGAQLAARVASASAMPASSQPAMALWTETRVGQSFPNLDNAILSHDGKLVAYENGVEVWVQSVDSSEPRRVPEPQAIGHATASYLQAFAPDDSALYVMWKGDKDTSVWRVELADMRERRTRGGLHGTRIHNGYATVADDGLHLAYSSPDGPQLYKGTLESDDDTLVATSHCLDEAISPDGDMLACLTRPNGHYAVSLVDLNGGGSRTIVADDALCGAGTQSAVGWRDTRHLLYGLYHEDEMGRLRSDLYTQAVGADGEPQGSAQLERTWLGTAIIGARYQGGRLLVIESAGGSHIWVGRLSTGEMALDGSLRRLVGVEGYARLPLWRDDETVLFALGGRTPHYYEDAVALDRVRRLDLPERSRVAGVLNGGDLLVSRQEDDGSAECRLYRRTPGGEETPVRAAQDVPGGLRCASRVRCARNASHVCVAFSQAADATGVGQLVLLDTAQGRPLEMPDAIASTNTIDADVSPDGTEVAFIFRPGFSVATYTIASSTIRPVKVAIKFTHSVSYARSDRLLVAGYADPRSELRIVDLHSERSVLLEQTRRQLAFPTVSPDGSQIAVQETDDHVEQAVLLEAPR
jgi:serine/threonine protein kinase/Tol biopolymer transport system component